MTLQPFLHWLMVSPGDPGSRSPQWWLSWEHSSGCLPFLPSLPDALLVFPSPPKGSPCRWILISGSAFWGIKAKTRLVQEFPSPPSSPLASSTYKSYNRTGPLLKPQSNAFMPGETSFHFTSLAFFSTSRAQGSIMQLPSYSRHGRLSDFVFQSWKHQEQGASLPHSKGCDKTLLTQHASSSWLAFRLEFIFLHQL